MLKKSLEHCLALSYPKQMDIKKEQWVNMRSMVLVFSIHSFVCFFFIYTFVYLLACLFYTPFFITRLLILSPRFCLLGVGGIFGF